MATRMERLRLRMRVTRRAPEGGTRPHEVPIEVRKQPYAGLAWLWFSVLGGFLSWSFFEIIIYWWHSASCDNHWYGWVMPILGLIALISVTVTVWAGWVGWRLWQLSGAGEHLQAGGQNPRRGFMGLLGLSMDGIFLYVTTFMICTYFAIPPCVT